MSCSAIPFSTNRSGSVSSNARTLQSEARSASRTTSRGSRRASSRSASPYAAATYSSVTAAFGAGAPAPLSGSPCRLVRRSSSSGCTASNAGGGPRPKSANRRSIRSRSSPAAAANVASSGAPACQRYVPPPAASAAGCSMNETPLPLIVSAIRTPGVPSSSRQSARNAPRIAPWSWPSQETTRQPKAASFASRLSRARISSVSLSDWSAFRSTTTTSRPTRWCAAACSASQFCPSWSSPSPVITTTRPPRPRWRLAQAIPRAFEMPMPSEPEFASIPGTPTSGCPSSPPSRRRRSSRSVGITPSAFSAAYSPGTSCPFDEKNTSRSGESKPSSATFSSSQSRCATTSSELKVEPRWPEPARLTATSAFARHMSARSPRRSSGSSPADPTRANSPGGISSSRGTA